MLYFFNISLFAITFLGGSIPVWRKQWSARQMKYLLAFSGSFLLSITFLHLIPETMEHSGHKAGLLILLGFFLQQFIQLFTHGLEHGHSTNDRHNHSTAILPVFIGLAFHAFAEGLPLGMVYSEASTLPSLYLAIALHKLPEAMLIASLIYQRKSRTHTLLLLALFALITPFSGWLTSLLGSRYHDVNNFVHFCIPVIAGAFIHIATTIFFESGTGSHDMNWKKWVAIISGVLLALLSTLNHVH